MIYALLGAVIYTLLRIVMFTPIFFNYSESLRQISEKLDWLFEIWKINIGVKENIEDLSKNLRRSSGLNGIRKR